MSVLKSAAALAVACILTGQPVCADWSTDRVEQDKRLEHLPRDLSLAVKSLRSLGYTTKVSSWDEKKRKLTADGDAGRYRWDGYNDFHYLDYYTLKYKGLVEDKQELSAVPDEKAKQAIGNLPPILGQSVERLVVGDKFLITKVRLPSCIDDSTALRLERLGQRIDIERAKYNYTVRHSHACDWWD